MPSHGDDGHRLVQHRRRVYQSIRLGQQALELGPVQALESEQAQGLVLEPEQAQGLVLEQAQGPEQAQGLVLEQAQGLVLELEPVRALVLELELEPVQALVAGQQLELALVAGQQLELARGPELLLEPLP